MGDEAIKALRAKIETQLKERNIHFIKENKNSSFHHRLYHHPR